MATTKFINECKKPANSNRLGKVTIGSTTINQHDFLANIRLSEKCYIDGSVIGTNYSKSVDINALDTFTGTLSSGETINPKLGVKYDDDTTDYIDFGNYTSEVSNEKQTSNSTSFTGYDKLINGNTLYECGITNFPCTVKDFYIDALNQLGLQPQSTTFIGSNIVVKDNPFTAKETVRQVLQAVEKVACAFGYINKQRKHELRWFSSSVDYEFNINDYSILEGGNLVYGPINRLLIGNSNIKGDYVIREDEQSISQIGANELYIYEPYFLYNDTLRNQVIDEIWNKVNGFTYTKYELTTYYGKPFLEIGNKIKINRNDGTSFESYILSHELNYNGEFTSVISADLMTKEEEEHKNNSKNTSPFAKVEIELDKQNQKLTALSQKIDSSVGQFQISNESSGKVVTAENAGNYLPVNLSFYGDSKQEGTPSPEYPSEIDVVDGYRNLYSYETSTKNYWYSQNGVYEPSSDVSLTDFIKIEDNIYSISSITDNYEPGSNKRFNFFDSNKQWLSQSVSASKVPFTMSIPSNAKYMRISFSDYVDKNDLMLNRGNIIDVYVPYGQNYLPLIIQSNNIEDEKVVNLPLGNNEFVKVGDVKDVGKIDFSTSQLVKEENIGKIVLTGDEYWKKSSTTICDLYKTSSLENIIPECKLICTHFKNIQNVEVGTIYISQQKNICIGFKESGTTTVDDFKQWLSKNPVTVYYQLETSTTKFVDLDSTTFEQLRLNQGHNELYIDDTLEPEMYMKYLTDSELNVQYAKTAELQLTNNQIISEVSETTKIYNSQFESVNKSLDSKLDSDNLIPILANYASTDSVTEVDKKVTNLQTSTSEYIGVVQDIRQNGVSQVRTETGFTFDKDGLTVSKSGAPTKTLVDEDGMKVYSTTGSTQQEMQRTDSTGTYSENVTVRKYLVVGTHTRFEDYSGGTGAFFIG